MKLLTLLTDPRSTPRERLLLSALASGLSSTFILAIVNVAAQEIADTRSDEVDWLLAAGFAAAAVVYTLAEIFLLTKVGADVEAAIDHTRVRLLERLRRADFEKIEKVGPATLYESITQSTQSISQNAQYLAIAFRSAILSGAVLFYILYVHWLAFVLVLTTIGLAGAVYAKLGKALGDKFRDSLRADTRMFESVTDLLDGFKELRMSSRRSRELGQAFDDISQETTDLRIDTQIHAFNQFIFGQLAFFVLLGVVVFVVPTYSDDFSEDVVKVTTAVLFMIGPVGIFIQSLGILGGSEAAAAGMLKLDQDLAAMAEPGSEADALPLDGDFRELRLKDVRYTYPAVVGECPFQVLLGDDLVIGRGEVVFITGGNGSGKSTMIKLLTGLYAPRQGHILVDGLRITPRHLRAYRGLIAAVFSDYHLFPRLYGQTPDADEAARLFDWLEMDTITHLDGDRFESTNLSAGQRKRLALIGALLENKPVLVLDEWAADQDPHFRRKFYREVLPELKRRGQTVIAVTHDDHYFDVADRRFHMEEGVLRELDQTAAGG